MPYHTVPRTIPSHTNAPHFTTPHHMYCIYIPLQYHIIPSSLPSSYQSFYIKTDCTTQPMICHQNHTIALMAHTILYNTQYHDMPSSLPPTRATTSETPSLPWSTSCHTSTSISNTIYMWWEQHQQPRHLVRSLRRIRYLNYGLCLQDKPGNLLGGLRCIKDLTKRKRLKIWSMPNNNRQGGWYRSLQVCESVRGRVQVYNAWECSSVHKRRSVHGKCNSVHGSMQECKCRSVQV